MKPKFIELTHITHSGQHKSVIVNVEHIIFITPYEDTDHGLITIVELTTKSHWFGSLLQAAETIEEIMQKIGG